EPTAFIENIDKSILNGGGASCGLRAVCERIPGSRYEPKTAILGAVCSLLPSGACPGMRECVEDDSDLDKNRPIWAMYPQARQLRDRTNKHGSGCWDV